MLSRFGSHFRLKILLIFAQFVMFPLSSLIRLFMVTIFMGWTLWVSLREACSISKICSRRKPSVRLFLLSFWKKSIFQALRCRSMPDFRDGLPDGSQTGVPSKIHQKVQLKASKRNFYLSPTCSHPRKSRRKRLLIVRIDNSDNARNFQVLPGRNQDNKFERSWALSIREGHRLPGRHWNYGQVTPLLQGYVVLIQKCYDGWPWVHLAVQLPELCEYLLHCNP